MLCTYQIGERKISSMRFLTILSLVIAMDLSVSAFAAPLESVEPAAVARGDVAGSVWIDMNCNGIKEIGEAPAANLRIVQLVHTGDDRMLNAGDKASVHTTDAQGNWIATGVRVNLITDEQPALYAIAVGKGSAAVLGYKPSPEGPDTILKGPTFASDTFQLHDGQTLNVGEIGVCPLPKVFLPSVRK
jgi:hypothetical protein